MESVGQNATLFPKSQISANFIFAQVHYFQQIKKLVSKVSKVALVTFAGRNWPHIIYILIHRKYMDLGILFSPLALLLTHPSLAKAGSPRRPCKAAASPPALTEVFVALIGRTDLLSEIATAFLKSVR